MGLFDRIKRAVAGSSDDGDTAASNQKEAAAQTATSSRAAPAGTVSASGMNADQTLQAIVSFLVEHSENKLSVGDIDPDADVFEYGYVDSLRVAMLFDFIEDRWGVVVPEVEIVGRLNTLKALAEFVAS